MYCKIDTVVLKYPPDIISVAYPANEVEELASGIPLVRLGLDYASITCTWGRGVSHEKVALYLSQFTRGAHTITYEDYV